MALSNTRVGQEIRRWPRRAVIALAVVAVLLVAGRAALPYLVRRNINARLASIPGYVGHVDQVQIHLWRGAYSLHGTGVSRMNGKVREPFFVARTIDFSVAWRELLHRKIVGDIVVDQLRLNFVQGSTKETSQTDADRRWQKVVEDIFPIDITYLEVRDGVVRYIDNARHPPADVFIRNMHLVATGLQNRPSEGGGELPAQINLDGDTLGGGTLAVSLALEPLAAQPHFHLSAKVQRVNLPALNQSLRAYANVDVGRGTFELAAEMAGKDGGFQGYVKPFFEDLDFKNLSDKEKPVSARLYEKLVAGLAWLVKNKPRNQVGTRVPFEGRFGDAKMGLLATIRNTFRHGFIRAFNPTIENTIHPDNILPSGKAANGPDVASVKSDAPQQQQTVPGADDNRAGAPTGRPSPKR